MEEILRNNPYFSGLTDEEIEELKKIVLTREYEREEIIFFEGEPGEALFFVQSGKIKLVKMTEDGKEQILHILKDGSIFAEVVLFDHGNYPATAIALEKTVVGIIRSRDMERLIEKNPGIAIKILRVMGKRLRRAQETIRNMGLKDTESRLAGTLVYLAEEFGKKDKKGITISLSLTQEDLSNMVGASRETISRILNVFEREGLVIISRKKIKVRDLIHLKKYI